MLQQQQHAAAAAAAASSTINGFQQQDFPRQFPTFG